MKKFWVLVRLQLRALLSSFRVGGSRKRAASGWAALALMAALCLYVSGVYSFSLGGQLAQMGALDLLLLLMPGMAVMAGMMFTAFAAQGVVFSGRDADLLLSMPVSAFSVLLAKLTALYAENLLFCAFLNLPAGIVRLWYSGGGAVFVLRLAVGTAFLALLPTVLSLALGFLLSWLGGKFANSKVVNLLLYGLLLAGVMALMIQINLAISALAMGSLTGETLAVPIWALLLELFQRGVCGSWGQLGLFCLVALGLLLVASAVLAPNYQRVLTGLNTHRKAPAYRLKGLRAAGQGKALLHKEAGRFFGTPIYLFNTGFGLVLLVIVGVAAAVMGGQVRSVLSQLGEGLPLLSMLAGGLAFMLSTADITGSSISLEGKYLWILKEAPISIPKLLRVKALFQVLLTAPCLLIGVVGISWGLGLAWYEGALLLALGLAFSSFDALFGLAVNLIFPKLDAISDMAVVKQSVSMMVSTFGGMAVAVLCGLAAWGLSGLVGELAALAACLPILLCGSLGLYAWLLTRGAARFMEL